MKLFNLRKKILLALILILLFTLLSGQMRVFDDLRDVESIRTDHFNILYKHYMKENAKDIAHIAEAQYDVLTSIMESYPYPRINILITDQADVPNGFATTVMDMTINVYMTNPEPEFIAKHKHWIEYVMLHEMTHILNMSKTQPSCLKSLNNTLLYLPNTLMPMWILEGVTVYNESTILSGRLYDTNYEAYLRAMILDGTLFSIHRASDAHNRRWPYGNLGYLYGGYIIDQYMRHGVEMSKFSNINPCTFFPSGICLPDIMTYFRTGHLPAGILEQVIDSAEERTMNITGDFIPSERCNITSNGGYNSNPVYIEDHDALYYNKFSEFMSNVFVRYEDGNEEILFYTSSSKSFAYDSINNCLYFEYLDYVNNVNMFYDIYRYEFDTGNLIKLPNTCRGMFPVITNDGKMAFIRNDFDSHYLIIYDMQSQSPVDSILFDATYRFYDLDINAQNNILAAVWREGGYSDIAMIDIDARRIDFLTSGRETDFQPQWSVDNNGFYFIADYDGINKVYYYDMHDSTASPVYESYYNVMDYDIDESRNIIYIEDLSGHGYDIYSAELTDNNVNTKLPYTAYKPYAPMQKDDINISDPIAYMPFLQYSSLGMYYVLPFIGSGNNGNYITLSGLNNNSDITLGAGYSLNVNPFTAYFNNDSSMYYDYNIALNLHFLYYNPDIYAGIMLFNDSSDMKPDFYSIGLGLGKSFNTFASSWEYSVFMEGGKTDSSIILGPSLSIASSTLDGGIKSIIPSTGIYRSLTVYSTYNNNSHALSYGISADMNYYDFLFGNNSYYIKLHTEYDKDSSIYAVPIGVDLEIPSLLRRSFYLPSQISDTTGFRDLSYINIGTEIPLAYPGMGIPLSILASTSIQLDYISAGLYLYGLYSFDKSYYEGIFGSQLSANFVIGGTVSVKPTLYFNYLMQERAMNINFSLGI